MILICNTFLNKEIKSVKANIMEFKSKQRKKCLYFLSFVVLISANQSNILSNITRDIPSIKKLRIVCILRPIFLLSFSKPAQCRCMNVHQIAWRFADTLIPINLY